MGFALSMMRLTSPVLAEGAADHIQGVSDFGRPGYGGHHYYFWVLALARLWICRRASACGSFWRRVSRTPSP